MKIVINACHGGYSLSFKAALALYNGGWKELGIPIEEFYGEKTA